MCSQGRAVIVSKLQLFSQIHFQFELLIDSLIDIFSVKLIRGNVQVNCKTKFLG